MDKLKRYSKEEFRRLRIENDIQLGEIAKIIHRPRQWVFDYEHRKEKRSDLVDFLMTMVLNQLIEERYANKIEFKFSSVDAAIHAYLEIKDRIERNGNIWLWWLSEVLHNSPEFVIDIPSVHWHECYWDSIDCFEHKDNIILATRPKLICKEVTNND